MSDLTPFIVTTFNADKALEAGYWYEWKNYKYKSNAARWNLNLSFMLKFEQK